jgi:hypothetical protein
MRGGQLVEGGEQAGNSDNPIGPPHDVHDSAATTVSDHRQGRVPRMEHSSPVGVDQRVSISRQLNRPGVPDVISRAGRDQSGRSGRLLESALRDIEGTDK